MRATAELGKCGDGAGTVCSCGPGDGIAGDARPAAVRTRACGRSAAAGAGDPARCSGADAALSAYAGDMRAREESPLSFRVGGNLMKRNWWMPVPASSAANYWPLLDPGDAALQAQCGAGGVDREAPGASATCERYRQAGRADQLDQPVRLRRAGRRLQGRRGPSRRACAVWTVMRNQSGYSRAARAARRRHRHVVLAEAGQTVAAGQAIFTLAGDGGREVAIALPESPYPRSQRGPAGRSSSCGTRLGSCCPARVRGDRAGSRSAQPARIAARVSAGRRGGSRQVELGQSARVYVPQSRRPRAALKLPLSAVQRDERGQDGVRVDRRCGHRGACALSVRAVRCRYGESSVPVLGGLEANGTGWSRPADTCCAKDNSSRRWTATIGR
jgi:multidrug efflux system membrane fusion protein